MVCSGCLVGFVFFLNEFVVVFSGLSVVFKGFVSGVAELLIGFKVFCRFLVGCSGAYWYFGDVLGICFGGFEKKGSCFLADICYDLL